MIRLGRGVTRKDEVAPIGGGQMHIDPVDGGEFLQHGPRGQPWRPGPQTLLEGDVKAIGHQGDPDRRLNARLGRVLNRPDG